MEKIQVHLSKFVSVVRELTTEERLQLVENFKLRGVTVPDDKKFYIRQAGKSFRIWETMSDGCIQKTTMPLVPVKIQQFDWCKKVIPIYHRKTIIQAGEDDLEKFITGY